ncbi:MAG: trigger factor [Candidatus Parcubacteria bacterium]|nr:trigger factor [Candidatus Parcubacteria bacterium]
MKVEIKKLPKSKMELQIEVEGEEIKEAREHVLAHLGASAKISGFREGKAPKEIIEGKISEEALKSETIEEAIRDTYIKALSENKIESLGQPEIEILKTPDFNNPEAVLKYKAKIAILPEIVLPDYKKIAKEIKRNVLKVEEKEIEKSLGWLAKTRAKYTLKNAPAKKGDFIEIEFGEKEGTEKNKDAFILGEGNLIPGLEDGLINMAAGQEKEISVSFPENHYRKDLIGKKVDFLVKMISVQNVELPEINDEFAKSLGKFENVLELKESVSNGIMEEKEINESERVRHEIIEKIGKEAKIEVPDVLIESEKKQIINELKATIGQKMGITFEDYLKTIKKTEEELLLAFTPEAEKRALASLVLRELGRAENVEVSDEEVKEEINIILKQYNSLKTGENEFDLERLREYTKEIIRNRKIFGILEKINKEE